MEEILLERQNKTTIPSKEVHIPFSRVDCQGNEKNYVSEVLDSGWLTTAGKARELENKFVELLGCKHAIAVNSCTAALHLAVDAAGVQANDKVLVPTYTFTASAEVIRYMGAHPVFLDVDFETCALSSEILIKAIKANPDAKFLIAVHFGGRSLDMENSDGHGIRQICEQHGITLIEDAAHAFPSKQNGKYVGSNGDFTCFSFYANKTMTTGEGGMFTTNSDKVAERVRLMRLHGINRDIWNRFTDNSSSWEYDVVAPGFKYNMPDLCAAVGLAQLERVEEMRAQRQRCARYYFEHLADIELLELPQRDGLDNDHSWHLFPIRLKKNSNINRNELMSRLAGMGIGTSMHYKPLHRLNYYKQEYKLDPIKYINAEKLWRTALSLPIYNLLSEDELEYIVKALRLILNQADR